jgi:hypothetical protein
MVSADDVRRAQNAEKQMRKRKKEQQRVEKQKRINEKKAYAKKHGAARIEKIASQDNVWTFWHRQMQMNMQLHATENMRTQYEELRARQARSVVQLVGEWDGPKAVEAAAELRMCDQAGLIERRKQRDNGRLRKAATHEGSRRHCETLINGLTKGVRSLYLHMVCDAATVLQSYRRMVLAWRMRLVLLDKYKLVNAARKIQALFRWRIVLRIALRKVRTAKHLRILIPTFKIQRTFRLRQAMRLGLEEQKALVKMTKAEQDEFWQHKKKDAELKISRQYREKKAAVAYEVQKTKKGGVSASAHKFGAVTNAAASVLQRMVKVRMMHRTIALLAKKRRKWEILKSEAVALAILLNPMVSKYVGRKRRGEKAVATINYPPLKNMARTYADQHR